MLVCAPHVQNINVLHCQHILDYYRHKRDTAMRMFEHVSANEHTYTAEYWAAQFDFYFSAISCLLRTDHFASLIETMSNRWSDVRIGYR